MYSVIQRKLISDVGKAYHFRRTNLILARRDFSHANCLIKKSVLTKSIFKKCLPQIQLSRNLSDDPPSPGEPKKLPDLMDLPQYAFPKVSETKYDKLTC